MNRVTCCLTNFSRAEYECIRAYFAPSRRCSCSVRRGKAGIGELIVNIVVTEITHLLGHSSPASGGPPSVSCSVCRMCCVNGKQSHPFYGQLACHIQLRQVQLEPDVLSGPFSRIKL